MREIVIDAGDWVSGDDFMDGILKGLDAPAWHGRNWNALHDLIVVGDVNGVEPPYRLSLVGDRPPPAELRQWIRDFVDMVADARGRGRDIEISVAPTLKVFS